MVNKIKRTFTSVLPVSSHRMGNCIKCGECCKLPFECPLLLKREDGSVFCSIYKIRTLNCRKYPRSKSELITNRTCGYRFR